MGPAIPRAGAAPFTSHFDELVVPLGLLASPVQGVFEGLQDDVSAIIKGASGVLAAQGDSKCKVKTLASLAKAQDLLDAAEAATAVGEFVLAAKSLKSALKAALRSRTSSTSSGPTTRS